MLTVCVWWLSGRADFKGNFPARATYAVKDLPKGAAVEIEAIATQ